MIRASEVNQQQSRLDRGDLVAHLEEEVFLVRDNFIDGQPEAVAFIEQLDDARGGHAQPASGRPMEWVVGFAAGGGSDAVARGVAEAWAKPIHRNIHTH